MTKRRDCRTKIEISEPSQLIAAIPCLLGFRPTNAIVAISLGGKTGHAISTLVRLDLPEPPAEGEVVETLAGALSRDRGSAALIVVIGRHPKHPPSCGSPPHRDLVEKLAASVRGLGRAADFAAWVPEIRAGARWHTYSRSAPVEEGVLPDESSTLMAAVNVAEGHVTFESREEMARQLQSDEPEALQRRESLLKAAIDALGPSLTADDLYAEQARIVRAAIHQVRHGDFSFSDDQVVRLAMALSNSRVRDSCLRVAVPPDGDLSRHAQRLWLELVRLTPAPERAEAAALLGYSAYMHGEGPLALMAFDNALDANPGHYLSQMLRICLERGLHPATLQCVGRKAEDLYRPASLSSEPLGKNDP